MPGITKILLVAKDFPQLNMKPGSVDLCDSLKMNVIHQYNQVFVFGDMNDVVAEKNGALKLISGLKEHRAPDTAVMHAIRKEFLKKVLVGYIKRIPVGERDKDKLAFLNEAHDENFGITTVKKRKEIKDRVLNNLDNMEATMVYHLYCQLALDLKEMLEKANLLPNLIEEKKEDGTSTSKDPESSEFIRAIVRKLINFVASGNFLHSSSDKESGQIRYDTTVEMSNFPRYILSAPW